MDPCLSNKITKNYEFIETNLIRLTKVIDKLMEDGHVTLTDKTEILGAPSRETQINVLLEKLITVGGTSFTALIEALKTTGNERIADQILQTDSSDDTAVNSYSSKSPREETLFSTSDSTTCDFREDEILGLYKEKQKYKVQLADMTTKYKQLQSELTIKEHKIETLNKELKKLHIDLEETKRSLDKFGGSDDFEGDIFRRMNTGTNTKEMMKKVRDLQLALDAKEDVITGLQKDLDYYKDQLDFVERQLRKQKEECTEKDARIMILRNQIGKLQNYLQASKQSLARLNNDQKKMLDNWGKEQLERFKDIEKKMEAGKVDQSKRFNTLEDKIDILIKMISSNGVPPALMKTVEKEKNKPVTKANTNVGKKGKSNRYKN